ncbi:MULTISPECIES: hypothetical protein [unclassified Nostoc]|uniref:Uncharacterized protein n=1 Tax=Nostoc punctiforme NIES-2108 TaxID=1356359 RepID=A0A367RK14_NOSPU|nr:hypothetical protein [Nostoc sp. JL31]MBN3890128.1 hypothetical protein [Nostoc sp. JL31]RCJ35662.1 hypothetical protein A6769_18630 [Nostoc punctiforme NIES-2108]
MTRIATKIALSVLGAAGISFLSSIPARAVIFVEPIVTTKNQDVLNAKKPRTLTGFLPGQVIEYGVPDVANNFLNATGYDINSLVFDLKTLSYSNPNSTPPLDNETVEWGDVNGDGKIGNSANPDLKDIFTDITIAGSTVTFSGGVIPNGTLFYNPFATLPNLAPGAGIIPPIPADQEDKDGPIRVASYYTAVPESTNVLGVLVFGALGVALKLKRSLC